MNIINRTVETTPQIHIRDVKNFISNNLSTVELALIDTSNTKKHIFVRTTCTPCHFGGKRNWFLCNSCGGRVAILYADSEFSKVQCRVCSELKYQKQCLSKTSRNIMTLLDTIERFEACFGALQRVRILHRGLPTRRFKRYLKYRENLERLSKILTA